MDVSLSLVDLLGREVYQHNEIAGAGLFEKKINIEAQLPGVYLLKLDIAGKTTVMKVLKN
ncbi:MAG: T9SS type A sorting domain-containing protein [Bacteroidia bacterium]